MRVIIFLKIPMWGESMSKDGAGKDGGIGDQYF